MSLFHRHGGKRKRKVSGPPVHLLSTDFYRDPIDDFACDFVKGVIEKALQPAPRQVPVLLEKPLSDHVTTATKRRRGALPEHLHKSNNGRAWEELMVELYRGRLGAILVWGPTGCGKTRGIKECANACGMRVFEIEPSLLDSTEALRKWVLNIVASKTLLGPRAILIDVLEGYDETYIRVFEQILTKQTAFTVPVIFVADSMYNYTLKSLLTLIPTKLRLFRPSIDKCVQFASMTFAKNLPKTVIEYEAQFCHGDLRILKQRLQPRQRDESYTFADAEDSLSLFATTQDMLLGKADIERWLMCSESGSLKRLVYDNYHALSDDKMDDLYKVPELLGTNDLVDTHGMFLCAAGLQLKQLNVHTKIPKLTLVANPPKITRTLATTLAEHQIRASQLDMPSLLLSRQTCGTV